MGTTGRLLKRVWAGRNDTQGQGRRMDDIPESRIKQVAMTEAASASLTSERVVVLTSIKEKRGGHSPRYLPACGSGMAETPRRRGYAISDR
jgi:hypothetical protein